MAKAPLVHVISNLDANGNPTSKPYSHGNYYWHTDKSYHAKPSFATLLHAVEIPPSGGDTQFANLHLAYEALPEARQRELAELRLEHSWEASRINTGNRPATEDEKRDRPPVIHPLVRTHPDTGRKLLYIGTHVSHVVGMERAESAALLEEIGEQLPCLLRMSSCIAASRHGGCNVASITSDDKARSQANAKSCQTKYAC